MPARRIERTRADAGRFGTMYDEGACMATPALELIERANREAAEARLAGAPGVTGGGGLVRSILGAPGRLVCSLSTRRP